MFMEFYDNFLCKPRFGSGKIIRGRTYSGSDPQYKFEMKRFNMNTGNEACNDGQKIIK